MRPEIVTLRAIDLDGNEILIEADDYLGRMFQHEIDHLDGILTLDRVDPDERKKALRALRDQELSTRGERHAGSTPRLTRTRLVRIVYLGTPPDAVAPLRALHDAGHDIALVVTQPDRKRGRGGALGAEPGEGRGRASSGSPVATPERAREVVDQVRATGCRARRRRRVRPAPPDRVARGARRTAS